jgi:hypothetical protein
MFPWNAAARCFPNCSADTASCRTWRVIHSYWPFRFHAPHSMAWSNTALVEYFLAILQTERQTADGQI